MTESPPAFPHAARIYEYLIGGAEYFPADAAAAEAMAGLIPSLRKWLPMLRDYLPRIAGELYGQGFRHFVDFGSGLPHNHLHSALGADALVVYSDIDELVVERGQAIVADAPNARFVRADLTAPRALLDDPAIRAFLGDPGRLAVGLSGVSVFFDPPAFASILDELYDALPAGSKLFVVFETKGAGLTTPALDAFAAMLAQAGGVFRLYSVEESRAACGRWSVEHFLPLAEFLGRPAGFISEADREGLELEFYSALLAKP